MKRESKALHYTKDQDELKNNHMRLRHFRLEKSKHLRKFKYLKKYMLYLTI